MDYAGYDQIQAQRDVAKLEEQRKKEQEEEERKAKEREEAERKQREEEEKARALEASWESVLSSVETSVTESPIVALKHKADPSKAEPSSSAA